MNQKNKIQPSWYFPLQKWCGFIPINPHPGAFAAIRKHDIHTGVDLYTDGKNSVFSVENGIIISIEDFTGPEANSPWWLSTKAVLIEGESGVVCYGEIEPINIKVGDLVNRGQMIAKVSPVLPEGKDNKNILNHSRFMLHIELYRHGTKTPVWWHLNQPKPDSLLNPTKHLTSSVILP